MQRRRFERQPDCGEKRDPDKRSLIIQKKENELDPDTQLEKHLFAAMRRRAPFEPTAASDRVGPEDFALCAAPGPLRVRPAQSGDKNE